MTQRCLRPLIAVSLGFSGACGGGSSSPPDAGTAPDACGEPLSLEGLRVTENPGNVLSFFVEWSSSEAASTELDVECNGEYQATFTDQALRRDHRVFVMGLAEGFRCEVTATSRATCAASEASQFEVSDLPSTLPDFVVAADAPEEAEPGWTILNLNGLTDSAPFLVVIVDEQGRIRWYHRRDTTFPSGSTDVRVFPEGVLIAGSPRVPAAMVAWDGAVLWDEDLAAHHEFLPVGEDRYFFIRAQSDCDNGLVSDSVLEWDQSSGQELWEWRICDHYDEALQTRDDWAHVNTIEPFPGEEAMLLSPRDQNNLVKVDLTTEEIVWILGDNGGFAMDSEDRFLRQHAPEILPSGNILLYDNGLEGEREYSRAIEIAYDEVDDSASVVWEYRPTPDLFTRIWGDVDRLANGNTLVTFGSDDVAVRSRIIEVDADAKEVWTLIFDLGWGVYRAERVDGLELAAGR